MSRGHKSSPAVAAGGCNVVASVVGGHELVGTPVGHACRAEGRRLPTGLGELEDRGLRVVPHDRGTGCFSPGGGHYRITFSKAATNESIWSRVRRSVTLISR